MIEDALLINPYIKSAEDVSVNKDLDKLNITCNVFTKYGDVYVKTQLLKRKFLLTFYIFMLSYNRGLGENSLDHSRRGEFLAIFVKKRDANERIKCFY